MGPLVIEYKKLKIREKKLELEGEKLQKEHVQDVKYFIDNHISDPEWQYFLEKTACELVSASVGMKVAKMKMEQISIILVNKGRKIK